VKHVGSFLSLALLLGSAGCLVQPADGDPSAEPVATEAPALLDGRVGATSTPPAPPAPAASSRRLVGVPVLTTGGPTPDPWHGSAGGPTPDPWDPGSLGSPAETGGATGDGHHDPHGH
jgi:hypothetical protein